MRKLLLSTVLFAVLLFASFSGSYAAPQETTPSPKPSNAYNSNCWDAHMIRDISVCGKASSNCIYACPQRDLKAHASCLNACSETHEACLKSASAAYKACIEAERRAKKQQEAKEIESKITQAPVDNSPEDQEKTEEQRSNKTFPVFIGEWFNAVAGSIVLNDWLMNTTSLMIGGQTTQGREDTEKDLQYIYSLSDSYVFYVTHRTKDDLEDLIDREPEISNEIVEQLKQKIQDSPFRLDILNGQAQIKYPGQNFWSDVKQGDEIPSGSIIFTGMDTTTLLTIAGKGVVQVQSFTEITISEKGLEEAAKAGQTFTEIDLKTGEIEVNIESGVYTAPVLQVNTPNGVAGVRGTHFWVSHTTDNNLSTVGVYEGAVEVKPRGSDTAVMVSPNGVKPGVIVIAQRLSTFKLISAGVVCIILILCIVLLKKRGKKVIGNKKDK